MRFVINALNKKSKINKEIYGHFSEHLGRCIYEGIFVGEDSQISNVNGMRKDVVNALKKLKIPVLRWPGGCFADEYHWMDGIGPKENRKKMINTHWGGVVEDNSFGTHEFFELCSQLGCEPYICGNIGSGTVREMQEWVEYMTFGGLSPMSELRAKNGRKEPYSIKYFGVGNETWGCGGNMRPEYYADEYRRYQTYLRNFNGNKLYKLACGPNERNYEWTDKLMSIAGPYLDAITLHYYTLPGNWGQKGSATVFDENEWYVTVKKALYMDELIKNHSKIMDKYDPAKRVGLSVDEWGNWYDVEPGTNPGFLYQQNTMRDAVTAGLNFNIFNKYSERVTMANIAQLVNVLQSVILTEGDKMLLTPTYHVFDMYKVHQDADLIDSFIEYKEVGTDNNKVPQISQSVSADKEGKINISLCNLSISESAEIDTFITGKKVSKVSGQILTGEINAHNTFDNPEKVRPSSFDGFKITDDGIKLYIPSRSVVLLTLE